MICHIVDYLSKLLIRQSIPVLSECFVSRVTETTKADILYCIVLYWLTYEFDKYVLGSVMEVHHPVCILALGSGQRLLYRLGSGLGLVLVLV